MAQLREFDRQPAADFVDEPFLGFVEEETDLAEGFEVMLGERRTTNKRRRT